MQRSIGRAELDLNPKLIYYFALHGLVLEGKISRRRVGNSLMVGGGQQLADMNCRSVLEENL